MRAGPDNAGGHPIRAPSSAIEPGPRRLPDPFKGSSTLHDLTRRREGALATTIVFDLDGTLVDTAPDLIAATVHTVSGLGHPCGPAEAIRPAVSHGALAMLRTGLGAAGEGWPEERYYPLLTTFLAHYEANIAATSRPFPGLETALDRLSEAGYRLAVCTNKMERLARLLLSQLGLDGRFATIAGRDTFDAFKPDPRHFVASVLAAGGDPHRAIMVGDSVIDVQTARNAGVPVVAVAFGYSDPHVGTFAPDALIHHYDELFEAVARLESREVS